MYERRRKKKPLQMMLKFELLGNAHQQGTGMRRKVKGQNPDIFIQTEE
jgi:hypothetical protein